MSVASDVQKLDPGAIVDLFELDTSPISGGMTLRWCNHVNELGNDVVFDGEVYTRLPVQASGFEKTSDGKQPRPSLSVANVSGLVGALARELNDLVGAKLIRRRIFVKYLDPENFVSGVNPISDPNARFPDEVWFVDRKASENGIFIEFELASSLDLSGVMLPRGQVVQKTCPWLYRGAECGYTGPAVAREDDTATAIDAEDKCGKRLASCELRFPNEPLNFGGFPGVGR